MFYPPNAAAFFEIVWDIARQIPAGKVSSYGQIASMIPPDEHMQPSRLRRLAPRWVGTAMRHTPSGMAIPWHRVINSRGAISFPAGSAKAAEQRRLLEAEGLRFDRRGQVNLAQCGWEGPDAAYLDRHGLLRPRSLR